MLRRFGSHRLEAPLRLARQLQEPMTPDRSPGTGGSPSLPPPQRPCRICLMRSARPAPNAT